MDAVNEDLDRRGLAVLKEDKVFWVAAAVFAAVMAPYFLPLLSEDQVWYWSNVFADPLLYGTALFTVLASQRKVESARERRFWKLVALALSASLLAEVTWLLVPAWTSAWDFVTESVFLLFYLGMALAVQSSRHEVAREGVWRLHWLRAIGIGVLAVGLLVYFEALPSAIREESAGVWFVALYIFGCLDVLLAAGFLQARSETADPRWRRLLGSMALVMATWAVLDFAEVLFYVEPFSAFDIAPLWDLPWYVPIGLLIVVARMSIAGRRLEPEHPLVLRQTSEGGGPLLGYTLALPLVHYSGYALGILDPALRDARDGIIVALLIVLGLLSLIYQRSVEHQNRVANEELRTGRERYESFLSTSAEGIYMLEFGEPIRIADPIDAQLVQLYAHGYCGEANDAMAKMYGFKHGHELVGRTLKELHGGGEDPANLALLRSFVESGYRHFDGESAEVDKDGDRKYFKNSAAGMVEDGFLVRVWGTQVDVTERRLAAVERVKLEEQLRQAQKMETMGTLAGGIAHDFNNVLSPIMGFAQLAANLTPPENAKVHSHLARVIRGTQRAQGMVNQILAVSRKQESHLEPMLVQETLADALELIRSTVPSTINIATSIDAGCPAVIADPGQIHQVVMNLCTNAYQAFGDSAGEITVELGQVDVESDDPVLAPGHYARLTVSDNGPGIPADIAEKVFEPFFTTKVVGAGTGLGLSVVHGIVAAHGGDIRLTTAPGEGAEFVVYLPTTDRLVETAQGLTTPVGGAIARILVVDDEEEVTSVAVEMLEILGFQATGFCNSVEALDAFRADPDSFDMVLTDHTMPNMTGGELARKARDIRPEIAVVIVSGYRLAESPEYHGEFEQLGKPFTIDEMADAVNRALTSVGGPASG